MGKNHLWLIFVYIIVAVGFYLGVSHTNAASEQLLEIEQIKNVMDKHHIEIEKWTLYTRDLLNSWSMKGEYLDELRDIQQKTSQFQWEKAFTVDHKRNNKIKATLDHPNERFTETLTYIVYPHGESYNSYLIYEINGLGKIDDITFQTIAPLVNSRQEALFNETVKFFTCVVGKANDKLNLGVLKLTDRILMEFSANVVEKLTEETFTSVSAYNNTWKNYIETNGEKMNLQVAIRAQQRLGGKTTVTIGTPIITSEY